MVKTFYKVPVFAAESWPELSHRESLAYMACLRLASFKPPRTVRVPLLSIAEAAGLHKGHTSEALRSLARDTDTRPALIEYRPAPNQHKVTHITVFDAPAIPESGIADGIGVPESGAAPGTAPGTADPARPAQTDPLRVKEPKNNPQSAFLDFWALYPKKEGQQGAERAYKAALKSVDDDTLLAGLRRSIDHWTAGNTAQQYIPSPANWLRGGHWADEYDDGVTVAPYDHSKDW